MTMHSFIITLTFNGKPVIFRFLSEPGSRFDAYEVSAINNSDLGTFLMEKKSGCWEITTEVAEDIKALEYKLGTMAEAYLEGQGLK